MGFMAESDPATDDGPRGMAEAEERFMAGLRLHQHVLWSVARGMTRSAPDADDVLQEAVVIGWTKRATFEPGTHYLAWMARIVRNVALNYRRKQAIRDHAPISSVDPPAPVVPAATRSVDAVTGRLLPGQPAFDDAVKSALDQLTPMARSCLLLRTVHGLDYQSIGDLLEIPTNTALSHVHRSRQSMRRWLAPVASAPEGGPGHA